LGGVEGFGPVEVLFGLTMLCDRGIDLSSGFIHLVLQILRSYLCQHSSCGDGITSLPIGEDGIIASVEEPGRTKSEDTRERILVAAI
jgi:hypothetical protein